MVVTSLIMDTLSKVVMKRLHSFYKLGFFCDVRLQLGVESVSVHSLILSTASSFIMEKYKKSSEGLINIVIQGFPELQCMNCLTTIIDFIYGEDFIIDLVHLPHINFIMSSLDILPIFVNIFENLIKQTMEENVGNNKVDHYDNEYSFHENVEKLDESITRNVTGHITSIEESDEIGSPSDEINEVLEVCIVDLQDGYINSPSILTMSTSPINNYDESVNSQHNNSLDLKLLRNHSNSSRLQNCLECDYQCYKPSELLLHLQKTDHGGNMCSLCCAKCDSNSIFREHLEKHNHPKPFFCMVCEQRFPTRAMMAQHLPKHSSETPYLCPYCNKGFKWKHGLNSHLIVHTKEKKHLCDECGYSTPHAKTLRAHKLMHTGDVFRCIFPGCKHTSARKENMKIHQATHDNDRPFVCEICGHKFTQNKNLKRHFLTHEKNSVKVHLCQHCTFSTFRKYKLKEHILKQHAEPQTQL